MTSLRELAFALFGAWRLAHLDRGGLQYFDDSIDGFWKSFTAALIVLPGYVLLQLLSSTGNAETAASVPWPRVVAVMGITYVISWVAYPLIMTGVTDLLNRRKQYIRFIIAYNWASVIQVAITLPAAALLTLSGADTFSGFVFFMVMVAVLVYAWFIAKEALDIPGLVASGLVALDVALNLFLNMVSGIMTGRI